MSKMSKVQIIKAPENFTDIDLADISIFQAGSIEMGKAIDWQTQMANALEGHNDIVLLNPRRDSWDDSWEQTINNPQFKEQVTWELDALDFADVIVMYFDKDTKSPITLLELGMYAPSGRLVVCCPDGFYRKGNVEVVCDRYDVPLYNTLDELIAHVEKIKLEYI
jgi:hypothetical protein